LKIKIFHVALLIVVILSVVLFNQYLGRADKKAVECDSYSVEMCPQDCVVCPPCPECSSISCQTVDFCESIGFNGTWYEDVKRRLQGKS
jgi:hypothetical protein